MTISTVGWRPHQWGFGTTPATWLTSQNMTVDAVGARIGGAIFDANTTQSLQFVSVGGENRILDGPIVLSFEMVSEATHALADVSPITVEVGFVPESQPENFSNTVFPWSRGEVSVGTFTITTPASPSFTFATLTFSEDASNLIRAMVTSRANWNGKLALSFRGVSPSNPLAVVRLVSPSTFGAPATLTTTQERFFNGLTGGPYGGPHRFVRDGRYGMPAVNSELIRDGDDPGLWVRAFDQDPEDPEAEYRPPGTEGTVTDGIPEP